MDARCQLCGVSFEIGRIRRPDEPEEAAWNGEGENYVHRWETEGSSGPDCAQLQTGCTFLPDNRDEPDEDDEHIASPNCVATQGFSGWRISLEEMKGCRSAQLLVCKNEHWQSESTDQDFERSSGYFLSGIADGSPEDGKFTNITPPRHGVSEAIGTRQITTRLPEDTSIPFHPSCFQIFQKASESKFGFVHVDGLRKWYSGGPGNMRNLPQSITVRQCFDGGTWRHEPGTEYLAANPVIVPSLQALLNDCYVQNSSTWDVGMGVFGQRHHAELTQEVTAYEGVGRDPFTRLPFELALILLLYLSSKDTANLRFASRVFLQLPNISFRRLVFDDLPWLWEARNLPKARTNWFRLYKKAKFDWANLKGLKNRKRIWKDIEEIMRKIQSFD